MTEVGCVKNKNENPVAEKAVRKLEDEPIRQEPGGHSVSEDGLAIDTARLNSHLRLFGLIVSGIVDSVEPVHPRPVASLQFSICTCQT